MTRRFSTSLALVIALAIAATSPCPADRLSGQLRGTLELKAAPPVPWRIEIADGASLRSAPLTLTAKAPGLELHASLTQVTGGDTLWHIEAATLDLVEWWPAIRIRAGLDQTLNDWRVGGLLRITGSGRLVDGQPQGRLQLSLHDAHAVNDDAGIELRGIEARLECNDLTTLALAPGQTIRIARAQAAGITASDALIRLGRSPEGIIQFTQFSVNAFEGTVTVEPFDFDPVTPLLTARLQLEKLSMPLMAALIPTAISAATGSLSGQGSITWHLDQPTPDEMSFTFHNPGSANLSLRAQPGLLSASVPPRLTLLPVSLGPFTRLLSPKNPAYRPLVLIELGRLPLRIDELKMIFTPKIVGQAGRTATLHLKGQPEGTDLIKSVTIDLNIHGSLDEVLSLGMDQRLR